MQHTFVYSTQPLFVMCLHAGKGGEMIKALQERAGCKMQMIQDGQFANAPEKPLRMTGLPESCKVGMHFSFGFCYKMICLCTDANGLATSIFESTKSTQSRGISDSLVHPQLAHSISSFYIPPPV